MTAILQGSLRERSIRYVKGVGPHRLSQLRALGLETLEDACYYPPRRYEDRTRLVKIRDLTPGESVTIRGVVKAKGLRRTQRSKTIFEAAVGDPTGICHSVWFNQPYLAQQLHVGDELILYGRVEPGARKQLIHPEIERVEGNEHGGLHTGRIVPIYPLASGLHQRWFRQVMATVLESSSDELEEPLPLALRRSKGWPRVAEAVRELHFPSSWEALSRAQERLAFDELLLLQLSLVQRRAKTIAHVKPQRYQPEGALTSGLGERLPFALTASQQRVLDELRSDLCQPYPMHRLLQGDVGCGKTIVIIFLIAIAIQSGYQVALMAPTELLAEQHYRVVLGYLGPLGVSIGLLSQGVEAAMRRRLLAAIAHGKVSVVIGTHALIQRQVAFQRLSLVIIDEQQKFGVAQRAHLAKKAKLPDVLVVTATPIPRTLALSIYGDLAVSTITELPPGRMPITTRWLREAQRPALYEMVRHHLALGQQGYVVYPLVYETATKDLKAASLMAKRLQAEVLPDFSVGLLHGQMKPKEKELTMLAFVRGELHLLVSTVIVEVGLDVPNASLMVVEHPEQFGLAQLHQLRGRIGRGAHPATCVVVSDATEEMVRQRLAAFVQTANGFELAQKDLELRGPGQLLGRQQHGWLRFRIAELARHSALLESARKVASNLIERDIELRDPSLTVLREKLTRFRQAAA
jgi:ATP-dependent DNA helicase RecG